MIKIEKPTTIPEILITKGIPATEENIALYEAETEAYQKGEKKFKFNSKIYGHKSVKNSLRQAQYGKCCFCERKEEIGDVEHFRPKSTYQQKKGESLSEVGYYWLAYDWDNLFYCCPKCNRSYKRSLFPLADTTKRATSHLENIEDEEPLFIHPNQDDPCDYIEFRADHPRAIDGNERGKITIEKTGIDRPFLNEERREYYQILKMIYRIAQYSTDEEIKLEYKQYLKEAMDDSAEYASMVRCALEDEFVY